MRIGNIREKTANMGKHLEASEEREIERKKKKRMTNGSVRTHRDRTDDTESAKADRPH